MAKVGIFFGSTTGNTEKAAKLIQKELGAAVTAFGDVKSASVADLAACDVLILGVSTWDEGQLQEDWASFYSDFGGIDFTGKKVALFGLGDQEGFAEFFVGAMGTLYKTVKSKGATVIGAWPTDGYTFDKSDAVVDGKFVGLALDEDNQSDETGPRIKAWVAQITPEIG
jgi:flavodoxin I